MADSWDEANRGVFNSADVVDAYQGQHGLMPDEALLMQRWLPPAPRVLDLGVGTGRTTAHLSRIAASYTGIDYAEAMVAAATKAFPGADLRVGDARDLSAFAFGAFDAVVFSYNGLDYLWPDEARSRCLGEIRRVLRPGGVLLLSRHNPRGLVDTHAPHGSLVRRAAVAGYVTGRRARRLVPSRAFWRGAGYVSEPARGGLLHHMATTRATRAELAAHGLSVVQVVTGRSSRRRPALLSPWYSYAAVAE